MRESCIFNHRFGGLGIPIFGELCEKEYHSIMISAIALLINFEVMKQILNLNKNKEQIKHLNNDRQKKTVEIIRNEMSSEERKQNDLNLKAGVSS